LSICTPPPPDAEGNPACNYRDGWEADPSGSAINVYYFREPANAASAEEVTADVRLKGDTTASQIAVIDPGQTFHRIQFPGIDKAAVLDVLLNTSAGRCFVIGPEGKPNSGRQHPARDARFGQSCAQGNSQSER
jgi:hypothetical protein